jgi:hypothetical protein
MDERVKRRRVLAGSVALVTVGLAGCSDDGDDEETESEGGGGSGGY